MTTATPPIPRRFEQGDTWVEADGTSWFCYQVTAGVAWLSMESWVRTHRVTSRDNVPAEWTLYDRLQRLNQPAR